MPLVPEEHQQAQRLLGWRHNAHLHLDWQDLTNWLADPTIHCWAAWRGEEIVALLGASTEIVGVSWLRLMTNAERGLLDVLWGKLQPTLYEQGIRKVAVLLHNPWFKEPLRRWGFQVTNAVVTLRRTDSALPSPPLPPLHIRSATPADLAAISLVDEAAFAPLWRHNEHTLRAASKLAATFSVLTLEDAIIGYQLSTHHNAMGHLARLAVAPAHQGRGLGGLLIGDMLRFFAGRGVEATTVNTQEDNHRSQRLYARLGFRYTGQRSPVLTLDL